MPNKKISNKKKKNAKKLPPDVLKKKLEKYFDVYLQKGHTISGLSHFLKDEGYPDYLIDEVAKEYRGGVITRKRTLLIGIIVLAVIVIFLPVYYWMAGPEIPTIAGVADCGFDKGCLYDFANDCDNAVYHQTEEESLVRYEVDGCNLVVSFERFSPDEPVEVTSFLREKSMRCPYSRKDFDLSWTESFLAPLEFCEGELKESLFTLRLAQARLAR